MPTQLLVSESSTSVLFWRYFFLGPLHLTCYFGCGVQMIRKEGYPEVCDASRGTCKSPEEKQRAEELLTVVVCAARSSSGNLMFVYFLVKVFPAGTGIVCLYGQETAMIHLSLPPSLLLSLHILQHMPEPLVSKQNPKLTSGSRSALSVKSYLL